MSNGLYLVDPSKSPQSRVGSPMGNIMQKLIDTKAAAPLIGISPATLENWRVRGEGPSFHKTPGRTGKVLYDPADIAAWREKRRFSSTAEATAADAE